MKYQIVPTIIAKNKKEFENRFEFLKKTSKHLQIDIMDGKFVKNKSNWFKLDLPKTHTYEAHLMVNEPEKWVYKNYKKFKIIITNIERVKNPLKLIKFLKSKKKKIGFALNPETSITPVEPYLKYLDTVLILTVNPGEYGAEFIDETEKIKTLRVRYKKDIEIDGHMNPETIPKCKKAGANIFAVGSYIQKSKNPTKTVQMIRKIIQ